MAVDITQSTADKYLNADPSSVKSVVGEITKSFARHQLNSDNQSPPAIQQPPSRHHSPAIPCSKAAQKLKSVSPKTSVMSQDDDSVSAISIQSNRKRRHNIGSSSIRDDESMASSSSIPSYMAATHSAKSKSKTPSPFGMENGSTSGRESSGFAKKQLSYPPSPARGRRHSGLPRVETGSIIDENVNRGSVH